MLSLVPHFFSSVRVSMRLCFHLRVSVIMSLAFSSPLALLSVLSRRFTSWSPIGLSRACSGNPVFLSLRSFLLIPPLLVFSLSFCSLAPCAQTPRYTRNVGLGFKTPAEAIEGTYVDKKCPFTGNVSIRGRVLSGTVKSMKMKRTVVVRRDYLHYISKVRVVA